MGGGKRNRGRGRGGSRGGKARVDHVDFKDMNNEKFNVYYRAQSIFPSEEWDFFLSALRRPLPTTFRVAGSRQIAHSLNELIEQTYVPSLSSATFEGEKVQPPQKLPWYPEGLAWHLNVDKTVLRKQPEFKKFHSFLVFETEVGNISRQEAVSMLPPLFLGVEPHHRVLDMCAAPGSKTVQLLEALHAKDTITASYSPPGVLIANDSDYKRTHLLIHQSARLPSPAMMVTNLDASIYPAMYIPAAPDKGKSGTQQLLFDRILCDVPCSGDGTMRKNLNQWRTWSPMDGIGLHSLQLKILQRAMRLLKPEGRIVYSTCSMNPVENEAVVTAALAANTDFELVDVDSQLPELVRRPGLLKWIPAVDRDVKSFFPSYEEWFASVGTVPRDSKVCPSIFPPSEEKAREFGLTRCMRVYPHLQDTGGFFVAVLQRKAKPVRINPVSSTIDLKREASESLESEATKKPKVSEVAPTTPVSQEMETLPAEAHVGSVNMPTASSAAVPLVTKVAAQPTKKKGDNGGFNEHPFTFISPDDPNLLTCIERLQLNSDFPRSNVLVRNPEGDVTRSLYMTNDIVKDIVKCNDYTRIRLTMCGVKVFTRQEAGKGGELQFRAFGEALPVVLPYVEPTSIMEADVPALTKLLEHYFPLCNDFEEPFKSAIEGRGPGSHIARIPAGSYGEAKLSHDLMLPLWKSNVSISLMVDKRAKSAMSLRLFGVDITSAAQAKSTNISSARPDAQHAEAAAEKTDTVQELGVGFDDEEIPPDQTTDVVD